MTKLVCNKDTLVTITVNKQLINAWAWSCDQEFSRFFLIILLWGLVPVSNRRRRPPKTMKERGMKRVCCCYDFRSNSAPIASEAKPEDIPQSHHQVIQQVYQTQLLSCQDKPRIISQWFGSFHIASSVRNVTKFGTNNHSTMPAHLVHSAKWPTGPKEPDWGSKQNKEIARLFQSRRHCVDCGDLCTAIVPHQLRPKQSVCFDFLHLRKLHS